MVISVKYAIIYSSRYGNNKRLVELLSEDLRGRGHEVQVVNANESDPSSPPEAERYVFSGASEAFSIARPMKAYMKGLPSLDGKGYALINTHCMKKRTMLKKMAKILDKKGMRKVTETDFHIGDTNESKLGLPEGYEEKLRAFAEKIK